MKYGWHAVVLNDTVKRLFDLWRQFSIKDIIFSLQYKEILPPTARHISNGFALPPALTDIYFPGGCREFINIVRRFLSTKTETDYTFAFDGYIVSGCPRQICSITGTSTTAEYWFRNPVVATFQNLSVWLLAPKIIYSTDSDIYDAFPLQFRCSHLTFTYPFKTNKHGIEDVAEGGGVTRTSGRRMLLQDEAMRSYKMGPVRGREFLSGRLCGGGCTRSPGTALQTGTWRRRPPNRGHS